MDDSLDTYRKNLEHVVRPEPSEERREGPHITIQAYHVPVLLQALRSFQMYYAVSETEDQIAESYIEYLNMCLYEEKLDTIRVYAHTSTATYVLEDACLLYDMTVGAEEAIMDEIITEISSMSASNLSPP